MSFDKMARELLMPIYERLQVLERDATSMQKLVGQLALSDQVSAQGQFTHDELLTIAQYVLECTAHSSGQRREALLRVDKRVRKLLSQ